jgi:hypothetical protein
MGFCGHTVCAHLNRRSDGLIGPKKYEEALSYSLRIGVCIGTFGHQNAYSWTRVISYFGEAQRKLVNMQK